LTRHRSRISIIGAAASDDRDESRLASVGRGLTFANPAANFRLAPERLPTIVLRIIRRHSARAKLQTCLAKTDRSCTRRSFLARSLAQDCFRSVTYRSSRGGGEVNRSEGSITPDEGRFRRRTINRAKASARRAGDKIFPDHPVIAIAIEGRRSPAGTRHPLHYRQLTSVAARLRADHPPFVAFILLPPRVRSALADTPASLRSRNGGPFLSPPPGALGGARLGGDRSARGERGGTWRVLRWRRESGGEPDERVQSGEGSRWSRGAAIANRVGGSWRNEREAPAGGRGGRGRGGGGVETGVVSGLRPPSGERLLANYL